MEERSRVGKEGSGLGEDLGIGSPAQSLVALRTVGGNGKIVRPLTSESVGYKTVDKIVTCGDVPGLEFLRH